MTDTRLLAVDRLSVDFRTPVRRAAVVRDIGFEVAAGQALAVVGESGCGKTVTALALLGLLPPQAVVSGSIAWQGTDLQTLPGSRRREYLGRKLAMVFQEPAASLNPVLRVADQVAEGLRLHGSLSARQARQRAVALLEEVRVPDAERIARTYPHQLSGGMQQRVMLASALACDPELLIADEPTTALDVTVQAQILGLIRRLRRDRGMALIFITHDLVLVPPLADSIAVMCGGRLVEGGPAGEVLAAPAHPYSRSLVESQPELWPAGGPLLADAPVEGAQSGDGQGCPFVSRCPARQPVCGQRFPARAPLSPRRWAACLPEVAGPLARQEVLP